MLLRVGPGAFWIWSAVVSEFVAPRSVSMGLLEAVRFSGELASVLLSGLTLEALYFLVTLGLSLVFGLTDVLNFAHGVIFMLGAYIGLTLYANPRTNLTVLPLALALCAGLALGPACSGVLAFVPVSSTVRRAGILILAATALALLAFGFANFPLGKLLAQTATATGGAVTTTEAQEAAEAMLGRLGVMFAVGLLASPLTSSASRPGSSGRAARSFALTSVLIGPMVGAGVYQLPGFWLNTQFGPRWPLILGLVFVLLVLFLPHGLAGAWRAQRMQSLRRIWQSRRP